MANKQNTPPVEGTTQAETAAVDQNQQSSPPPKTPPPVEKPKQVRVICEGTLGPRLLEKSAVTSDPQYVALLGVKGQKKVELVK